MAVKTPYLAAENSAMDRRSRGLHRFLVSSPVLLLIAVGLVGHLKKPHHIGAAGSAEYEKRVLAYRERVAAAQKLLVTLRHSDPDGIEAEAKNWSDDFAAGKLTALPPAAYEDHLANGVRGEVLQTALGLATSVIIRAEHTVQEKPAEAAGAAMLAAETAFGVRNFELESHIKASMVARRSLNLMIQAWPTLPEATREAYRVRLRSMVMPEDETQKLADLEKRQLREYIQRMGQESLNKEFSEAKENATTDREELAARRGTREHGARLAKLLQP